MSRCGSIAPRSWRGLDRTSPVPRELNSPGPSRWPAGTARKAGSAPPRSGTSPGGCSATMTTAPPPGAVLETDRGLPNRRLVRSRCGPTCSSGWSAACGHAPTPPAAACRRLTGTAAPSAACSPFPRRPVPTAARECSSCCTATNAVTSASAATSSSVPRKRGFVLGPTAPDIPALEVAAHQPAPPWPVRVVLAGQAAHPAEPQLDQDPAQRQAGNVQLQAGRA